MDLIQAREFHLRTIERTGRSPATLSSYGLYEGLFLTFLEEHGIAADLEALNPQFVREWQGWLRARSRGSRGGVVAERHGVTVLKVWARFLMDNDVYGFDPLSRLKKPKVTKIHRKPFSEDEARRLVQAAAQGPNPIRDRALLLLLFDTGCRIGELLAAEVDDLDLAEGSIVFRFTKNRQPRRVVFRVGSRRDGGACLSAVRNWLKVREAREGVYALFTTRERLPLSARRAREIFAELGRVARVPNCHPHRTRHSAASEFLSARPGAENQLRSRLGHVSEDVLSDYITFSDRSQYEAAEVASLSTRWKL